MGGWADGWVGERDTVYVYGGWVGGWCSTVIVANTFQVENDKSH